jgi:DNA segregation ATPase FtsK/SpoIIIE, S-DNA-T family
MNTGTNLNEILESFKIKASCVSYKKVRNVTLYDILLNPGTRVRDLQKFSDEISLVLRAKSKPFVRPIPEHGIVRLEVIDESPYKIALFDELSKLNLNGSVPMYLGSSIDGNDLEFDIAKNPHTLIAGCTGSGKSTLLHVIIANALASHDTNVCIIDSKNVEFESYKKLNNVCVANSFEDAIALLQFVYDKMEKRYSLITEYSLASNYFTIPRPNFPQIVFIIDEYADMVMQDRDKAFHSLVCKLAQKCRAAGIYCVLATQRPSVDIISGSIKANFPARISCQTASGRDSKVILDATGAELLAGMGDAIIKNYKYNYQRFQIAYTGPEEVCNFYAAK